MRRRFGVWTLPTAGALGVLAAFALEPSAARADNAPSAAVTYTKDIAPIFLSNCAQCHRPGALAPMALRTYDEVRPWAKSIRTSVETKKMPPWGADTPAGKFHGDLSLTNDQIALISSWVEQGAPQGDPAAMPAVPEYPSGGWTLGEPDYILDLGEIEVPASGDDYFPNISATIDIPRDRWLRAAEVMPGNVEVLHHVVGFLGMFAMGDGETTQAPGSRRDQKRDRGSANLNGGGNPLDANIPFVWAVGSPPQIYPEGMGKPIKAGSPITINMHYHPNGTAQKDRTKVGLYFGDGPIKKEINIAFAGTFAFRIPPHAEDHVIRSAYFFDDDSQIVSFFPHMHMRGKSMKYTATFPDGRKEVLLDVPRYDFNWQWFYYANELIDVPAGTRVDVEAHYDNSAKNPNNPDPTIALTFGEASDEEMSFGVIEYIVKEGVKPGPINVRNKIRKLMAAHPVEASYEVGMKMGGMNFPSGVYLPHEGNGMWYLAFGRQLMTVELNNIKWEGEKFTFELPGMGEMEIMKASGTVDANGQINAEFDTAGLEKIWREREERDSHDQANAGSGEGERRGGERMGGRGGPGMGGMFMRGFSGSRMDKLEGGAAAAGQ